MRQTQLPIARSPLFVTPDNDKGETDTCFILVEKRMRRGGKDASGWPGVEEMGWLGQPSPCKWWYQIRLSEISFVFFYDETC